MFLSPLDDLSFDKSDLKWLISPIDTNLISLIGHDVYSCRNWEGDLHFKIDNDAERICWQSEVYPNCKLEVLNFMHVLNYYVIIYYIIMNYLLYNHKIIYYYCYY